MLLMKIFIFEELDQWKWKILNDFNILFLRASIIMFLVKDEFYNIKQKLNYRVEEKSWETCRNVKGCFL